MIKPASGVKALFIFSLFLILFFPYKYVQIIAISLIFIIIISYFWARTLEKKIKITRDNSEIKSVTFEKLTLSYTIENSSNLTAFMCYTIDNLPFLHVFEKKNQNLILLKGHTKKTFFYEANAQFRGLYFAGPVNLKTYDPLCLFTINKEFECKQRIVIRPARISLVTKPVPGLPQGKIKINNNIYEDVTMRRCIREYKNGDELKRINWRASAKFNALYTNEYENTFDVPFFIFLNLAKNDYSINEWQEHTEKAIEIAASIVNTAAKLNQKCGFAAYGSGFPFIKTGDNQYDCILDILSIIKPEEGKLNYDPEKKLKTELSSNTLLFVIGPEEVSEYITKISAKHYNITTQTLGIMKEVKK